MTALSPTQIDVLRWLDKVHSSRIKKRTADPLVRMGLAERVADDDVTIAITADGRAAIRKL